MQSRSSWGATAVLLRHRADDRQSLRRDDHQSPSFPAQDCEIANGTGTIAGDVTNVLVTCSDLEVATLQADPGPAHAVLRWSAPSDTTHFNVYFSSARDCEIANYSTCPDGTLLADVSSPLKVRQLRDGQAYFFRVETIHTNGARGLSMKPAHDLINSECKAT